MKHLPRKTQILVFSGIAVIVVVLDRFLKYVAQTDSQSDWLGGLVRFELFRNDGIAFSLPFSGPLVWVLSVAILLFVARLAYQDFRTRHDKRAEAYALFTLGALSNLFDRVVYGYTVDYLIFFKLSAVNIADGMIVSGVLWLLLKAPKK